MFKDARTPAERRGMDMYSRSTAEWMKKNPKIVNKYDQHTRNEDGSKKTYAQLYNGNKTNDTQTALALGLIDESSVDDWDADK